MPRLADIPRKVLVLGSGPIVIGQAAEFDYAGTQACKALREEGVITVLVNSNPATIMTDLDIADAIYIEPLTVDVVERIIKKEQPDGILPTLGGQTGLNLAVGLAERGILSKYNVRLLGTPLKAIRKAEDREEFKKLLISIGEPQPNSVTVSNMTEASRALDTLGLPLVVRPAYTLGGTGGGMARTTKTFREICQDGLAASPINQILVERSLEGWREIEYEVIRDGADNCITVCNMENIDPMGVHTGDSIVVAPSQTLTDKEYQMLRSSSLKIIRELGIEGGCNVQFALRPHPAISKAFQGDWHSDSDYYVIEVNPRVSRSSALASKATGYPIARIAAKIAVGKRLDEIPNAVTEKTLASFEPALDYCVVKIPRWPFDKFPVGDRGLSTQMKATGEVMAIDHSFESALQKAVRSLEVEGRSLLWEDASWNKNGNFTGVDLVSSPNDLRLWALMAGLRRGIKPMELSLLSGISPWFTAALERIVGMERRLLKEDLNRDLLIEAKRIGFSDDQVGALSDLLPERVREIRKEWGITPVYKMVDTCAAEFEAVTPYFYSTYEQENEALPLEGAKAIVIGSGPIRIGQGIEFDYCSVHAAWALQQEAVKSVLVNSNPETVSTDFDTSDRLYFEPLDEESLRDIIDNETINGIPPPTVVQFGGQTALDLSQVLESAGLPILGSSAEVIDIASDRKRFDEFMERLGIPQPPGAAINSVEDALKVAQNIGYPVVVRPSYVLGGRAMEIVRSAGELISYLNATGSLDNGRPVLVDQYMEGKECEVDAVCDGETVLIPGIIEHIERAGVHSGDSMAIYPALNLSDHEVAAIVDYTTRIGIALDVKGLMNVQFVIVGGSAYRSPNQPQVRNDDTTVYVLEVNPRSSRTVPFISKVTGAPVVNLATRVVLGKKLCDMGYKQGLWPKQRLVAIKAPVFSMSKLTGVDSYLGPEMKSTGEVMGVDFEFKAAVTKALIAAELGMQDHGSVLLSIADRDKAEAVDLVKDLLRTGCNLYATEGTAAMIQAMGGEVTMITKKLGEGRPNVVDVINDGTVTTVINTVSDVASTLRDGFHIRRAAAEIRTPCYTSLDTARVAVENILIGTLTYSIERLDKYLNEPLR
ncbi:carbamoyl-phosphate synthase large subunit [SAR202 cluster bacterium AD-804-J14_MRT_500m]|nr:carbamoyl-phosphate synthase large subunit [SAR202 cluster bacterium AD-804-J14_MRT_500m]